MTKKKSPPTLEELRKLREEARRLLELARQDGAIKANALANVVPEARTDAYWNMLVARLAAALQGNSADLLSVVNQFTSYEKGNSRAQ